MMLADTISKVHTLAISVISVGFLNISASHDIDCSLASCSLPCSLTNDQEQHYYVMLPTKYCLNILRLYILLTGWLFIGI